MPPRFFLRIETDEPSRGAALRLTDEHDGHLGSHEVRLDQHPPSAWEGAFDTRAHVQRMQSDARPASALLAEIGTFLADHVLGPQIMAALTRDGIQERALVVQLPDAPDDKLATAFARVPWEIAMRIGDHHTLLQSNVTVRATAGNMAGRDRTITLGEKEPLRVLLVLAEAPGSRPLAMRLERERLMDLFFDEVLPSTLVEIDVLCHGVTRARLTEQMQERGGYHIIHWSGHGHHDRLEVDVDAGDALEKKIMTGADLVDLLRRAGGVVPDLFFLSACHSGSLANTRDWETLRISIRDRRDDTRESDATPVLDKLLHKPHGHTGTALQLLRAGVSQVVAMRAEVGDAYARRLARRFYRHLLVGRASRSVEAALALARSELMGHPRTAEHHPVDHATPLLLGSDSMRFSPARTRSPQADRRDPRHRPLLPQNPDLERPRSFVGRGLELRRLANEWLDRRGAPVALIQGLAGLGKTSLAAEVIHLWHPRFDHVLAFTARGGNLTVEDFLRLLDQKLSLRSKVYRDTCTSDDMARVFLPASKDFTGKVRRQHLRENLTSALCAERFLLVLDNLEPILRPSPRLDGAYDAQDPEWDRVLVTLAEGLGSSGSRVLVTSRHLPAALAHEHCITLSPGPLPMGEAVLLFQDHTALGKLFFSEDSSEKKLAERVLSVSRGHPLILQRLATVAREGAAALAGALDRIEGDGFKTLPDVLAGAVGAAQREQERRYLEDVAIRAVDLLIERLSPEARQLLWVVTRAFEGVDQRILEGVWEGHSSEDEQCAHLAEILEKVSRAPAAEQERLPSMPEDVRVAFEAWIARGRPGERGRSSLPLADLLRAGLVHRDDEDARITFHELVAERAGEHAKAHPSELGSRTESEIWTAYGDRYRALFWDLLKERTPRSRDAAVEMGKRGIRYLARAREFDRLGAFAGTVITNTTDTTLLGEVISELQGVVEAVPASGTRWCFRTYLADALRRAGRPDQAIGLYAQAAEEAEAAGHWDHVGAVYQNWANALGDVDDLTAAKAMYQRSSEAKRRAGSPFVDILMSDLEALRVDVIQDEAMATLPAIEAAVVALRDSVKCRETDAAALDEETLGRALVSGLDVARMAYLAVKRWEACLDVLDEMERVKRNLGAGEQEISRTRFSRSEPLLELGRIGDAKQVLESCLDVFRRAGDIAYEAKTLLALANVWSRLDDVQQAVALARQALAACECLPTPGDRAAAHGSLAVFLQRTGRLAEADDQQLANLGYRLVTGLGRGRSLQNLATRIRDAALRGEAVTRPRLVELLAKPAFAALREWLASRATSIEDLQAGVDQIFELVRTDALLSSLPLDDPDPPADAEAT